MKLPRKKYWNQFIKMCLLVLTLVIAGNFSEVKISVLFQNEKHFGDILGQMFPPDFSYTGKILPMLFVTLQMSVVGTFAGAVTGLVLAAFCAANINGCQVVRTALHMMVQLVRTIPVLILALINAFLFGAGSFAGTAALFLYTTAIMAKQGYEDIEHADMHSFDAIAAAGVSSGKNFCRTILPEVIAGYVTNVLYLFEANVRNAAILGYVGAGGLGILLNEKIAWREYAKVGMILLIIYIAVLALEMIGERIGLTIRGKKRLHKYEKNGICIIVVLLFAGCLLKLELPSFGHLGGKRVAGAMLQGLLVPDFQFLLDTSTQGVPYLILQTIFMAVIGTFIGTMFALPFSILGSTELINRWIAYPMRCLIAAIRTIPVFIYAIIFVRVTGPGAFAGCLTLGACSMGLLCKRFIVAFDSLDLCAWEAYGAMGISWMSRIKYCIWPQIKPFFFTITLYRFDVNIREASILGLVGAGGIGAPLILAMNAYKWKQAGAILWGLFITVLGIEILSQILRKKV